MACASVSTGKAFLSGALQHIDCQAQAIGSYGYGALADPGSMVSIALTGLLTVFIAIFGMRLALGQEVGGRDLVGDVLRIAIVLTLATSWPAWRVVGYDVVIHGPQEVANVIGQAANLPGSKGDLPSRLQRVDDAIAALNEKGAGRPGVANGDWFQLGFARVAFLIGALGPLALVRLAAGFLLAIAPLVAGLMLFGVTRSIFAGWAKGLVATFLTTIGLSLVLSAQLAMVEPWLRDVIRLRIANEQTLNAPVELLIMTLVFALSAGGMIALGALIANHASTWIPALSVRVNVDRDSMPVSAGRTPVPLRLNQQPDRPRELAASVGNSTRRSDRMAQGMGYAVQTAASAVAGGATASGRAESLLSSDALGSSYRRTSRRASSVGERRDKMK